MEDRDKQKALQQLQDIMNHRQQTRERVASVLGDFCRIFFDALENAALTAQQSGVKGIGTPRRIAHPAGHGLTIFQLPIEDWSILFVPMVGVARPAPKDEAQIPPARFKDSVGRIAAFLGDSPDGEAFYDVIMFDDGSWFAWGYGWPRQDSSLEQTDFDALAYELLVSFTRDIYTLWPSRAETTLRQSTDKKYPAYEFRVLRADD